MLMEDTLRCLTFTDLRSLKGIQYSRTHVTRLMEAGGFPLCFSLGGKGSRTVWNENDIDRWLAERQAAPMPTLSKPNGKTKHVAPEPQRVPRRRLLKP
jgi:predicted DNA-binding transcriptional regulator AlpA